MSEFTWGTEVMEEVQPPLQEQAKEQETLALSVDEFSALEERIVRAVDVVRQERQARSTAEERAAFAELQLSEQEPLMEKLQEDVKQLRTERDQVRQRVERLLAQLDALEL